MRQSHPFNNLVLAQDFVSTDPRWCQDRSEAMLHQKMRALPVPAFRHPVNKLL